MSCLSEQERIALEEIFLSISVNESPLARWRSVYQNPSHLFGLMHHAKKFKAQTVAAVRSRKNLKTYAAAKLFVRTRKLKLSKHLSFKPFSRRG